jgi:hypothetical protein
MPSSHELQPSIDESFARDSRAREEAVEIVALQNSAAPDSSLTNPVRILWTKAHAVAHRAESRAPWLEIVEPRDVVGPPRRSIQDLLGPDLLCPRQVSAGVRRCRQDPRRC